MHERRERIVAWVGREILPHEAELRRWLARMVPSGTVEDVVQDIYCKLAALEDVAHIRNARAYLFQTARTIILDQIRRARIVQFEAVTELEAMHVITDEPSPERVVAARRELARVERLIAALPERCRRIFEMRKVQGLPQREIARIMGVTETVVENDVSRGTKIILKALAEGVDDGGDGPRTAGVRVDDGRARNGRCD